MHAGAGGKGFAEAVEGGGVGLVVAVGEVEAGDVHACMGRWVEGWMSNLIDGGTERCKRD